jgi:1,4-dihydroxy-2-naphthoate octaprenyltransferase
MTVAPPMNQSSSASAIVRSMRLFSLPASVLAVLVALAAAAPVGRWQWDAAVLTVLGVGLLHVAGNMINDFFDFRYGVDRRVEGDENRPGRVLVRRMLSPRAVLLEAGICVAAAMAAGVYLAATRGIELLWFAVAAGVALYAYTGPPLRLKYHALGEITIFVVFGPVMMLGAAWAQLGRLDAGVLLLSVPVGLATTAILIGNNCRDIDEDRQARIRTIAHIGRGGFARGLYVVCAVGAAVGLAAIGALGAGPLALVACPLALALLARPMARLCRGERIADIDAQTARYEAVLLGYVFVVYLLWGHQAAGSSQPAI